MPAADLQPGTIVGEYSIDRVIGEGSFGKVYAATHPVIGKTVAVKVLALEHAHKPQQVSRFIEEARAVNRIRHKNIVDIFSFGQLPDGRHYFVMELLEGKTLGAYMAERGRLPIDEALPLFRKMARALDAAHAAGIAHRDLKPDNLMLLFDEDGITPKLLDFGIAKLMDDSQQAHRTATGVQMGTPLYMSPEQCRGQAVDHRTDMYSFGVLVHEMLSGRRLFDQPTVPEVMVAHMSQEPPKLSEIAADLPPGLDVPVLKLLAKDPAARPATIGAAVEEMAAACRPNHSAPYGQAAATMPAATVQQPPMPHAAHGGGHYGPPAAAGYGPPQQQVARSLVGVGGTLPSAGKAKSGGSRFLWAIGGGCMGMTLIVVGLIAIGIVFGDDDRRRDSAREGETTSSTEDSSQGVLFEAKPPRLSQKIGLVDSMEMKLSFIKNGQRLVVHQRVNGRSEYEILAIRGDRVTKLRVHFDKIDERTTVNDAAERRTPTILPGKTYEVRTQGNELEVRRAGGGVSAQEAELVTKRVDDMFQPNALAELLDGKRIALGTKKKVDPELALRIFGFDADKFTVVDPVFTLREVSKHGDGRVAHFDLRMGLAIDGDEVDLNAKLNGQLSVQVDTLYAVGLELTGPIEVDDAASRSEPGKLDASVHIDYR